MLIKFDESRCGKKQIDKIDKYYKNNVYWNNTNPMKTNTRTASRFHFSISKNGALLEIQCFAWFSTVFFSVAIYVPDEKYFYIFGMYVFINLGEKNPWRVTSFLVETNSFPLPIILTNQN